MTMKLETLPNEILLDLFIYFNGTDLLQAFYGLNSRFNLLLYKQYRSYIFQFNSISKHQFDTICQQHLPFIVNQIITLNLFNYAQTPKQIELFFSYIPSLTLFTYLRSLRISKLHIYPLLLQILNECQHLPNLTELKLRSCSFRDFSIDIQLVIDKIWSLPKLIHCHINIQMKADQKFCIPTIISSSMKNLSIYCHDLEWNQINQLIESTPHLKCLSASVKSIPINNFAISLHSTLIECTLYFYGEDIASQIHLVIQCMPNLRHLNINICEGLMTGHQWERIIRHYLSKLKIFRLRMRKYMYSESNMQETLNELINSFRTPFWIDERKWFVQCFTRRRAIHLSTRFNTPHYFDHVLPDAWQSTCPDDNLQEFYKNKTSLTDELSFEQLISSNILLPNLNYLHIKFPINDQFWLVVPNFNQLKTLSIWFYADIYQSQLQILLDRAPRLNKLTVRQDASLFTQTSLFNCKNISIRQLDFYNSDHIFSEEECLLLTCSSLIIHCEVLSIKVGHRQCILNLIKNIPNLRSLIINSSDDQYEEESSLTEQHDESIQWLKDRLPSSYMIVRDFYDAKNILIWI